MFAIPSILRGMVKGQRKDQSLVLPCRYGTREHPPPHTHTSAHTHTHTGNALVWWSLTCAVPPGPRFSSGPITIPAEGPKAPKGVPERGQLIVRGLLAKKVEDVEDKQPETVDSAGQALYCL